MQKLLLLISLFAFLQTSPCTRDVEKQQSTTEIKKDTIKKHRAPDQEKIDSIKAVINSEKN